MELNLTVRTHEAKEKAAKTRRNSSPWWWLILLCLFGAERVNRCREPGKPFEIGSVALCLIADDRAHAGQ